MSAFLSTIVGLMLVFLVFAIVVSGVQEWWAQYRGHRGRFLLIGLRRLVDDEPILARLLQHPLIGGLYRSRAARSRPPSYVEPRHFALALSDVVIRREATAAATTSPAVSTTTARPEVSYRSLRSALDHLDKQRSPIASALLPIVTRTNGDLDQALDGIAAWFNDGMDRVSGWYKGYAQRRLFVIGLLVAILGNVDAIALFTALNHSPAWSAALRAEAEQVVRSGSVGNVPIGALEGRAPTEAERADAISTLERLLTLDRTASLPLGHACFSLGAPSSAAASGGSVWDRCVEDAVGFWRDLGPSEWLKKLVGIVLTALAGVLGAPFWFAAMSKLVNLRGSGPRPSSHAT